MKASGLRPWSGNSLKSWNMRWRSRERLERGIKVEDGGCPQGFGNGLLLLFFMMANKSGRLMRMVEWFNKTKGFGFITPDDGDEDLFVHQSLIKVEDYRSLTKGEP
ncbi:hypothetical protein COCNU_01G020780 [Cocos nucifera]|uniref:CSD domain-containing protein n=1 Tax=Cocos nucifera TaxID=13894 RepID=A0A8K0HXS2_COCNU|nr:hypothetical protein COCNU_01G020780 [Cocos nucifera]